MKAPILTKNLPVYSSQHGATITLIVCWTIPVLLSKSIVLTQITVLIFLLSGFSFMDLGLYMYRKGGCRDIREKIWFFIYFFLFIFCGLLLALSNPVFKQILPFLLIGGCIYLVLVFQNKEDNILTILLTFSLFALAGLMAFSAPYPGVYTMGSLWIIESVYFGLSSLLIKYRINKIDRYTIIISMLLSFAVLAIILSEERLKYSIMILLGIKIIFPVVATKKFRQLKIKKIGLIELGSSIIFLTIVTALFKIN